VADDTLREACLSTELCAGSYAHLEVEDDGSGIKDAVRIGTGELLLRTQEIVGRNFMTL